MNLLINRFLNGHPYLCRAVDISRSGMRLVPIIGPCAPPPFMGLQLQLPNSETIISASGEAVSTCADGGPVGVRFTRLDGASAEIIDRFVSEARD